MNAEQTELIPTDAELEQVVETDEPAGALGATEAAGEAQSEPEPEPDYKALYEKAEQDRTGTYARLKREQARNQEMALVKERLDRLQQANQPQGPEDILGPEPDKNEDPAEWLDWRRRSDDLGKENIAQQQAEYMQQQAQQQAAMQQVVQSGMASEQEFLSRPGAPDKEVYSKTLQAVREREVQRLVTTRQVPSEIEARQVVRNFELNLLAACAQNGENAAEAAWNLAKQYGVVPSTPQQATRAPQGGDMARMQAGVQAGGMGGVQGGQGGGRQITYEQMAKMSEKEFDAFLTNNKITEDQMDQAELSGGVLNY